MRGSRLVVKISLLALLCLETRIASQNIDISQQGADSVRVRVFGEGTQNLGLETSTNFQSWDLVATTNSSLLEFTDPNFRQFSRRFFRASLSPINTTTFQIVSPANDAVVTTSRPTVEVTFSGINATANNLVLRLQGTNLPTRATIANNRATFELLSSLPEGFVTIVAAYVDANSPTQPVSGVNLNVRTTQNNLSPTAQMDFAHAPADTAVTVPVLANDKDPNDDLLSISSFTQGTNGAVSLQSNALIYTPAPGFFGKDRFIYTINDGSGGTATADVRIAVSPQAGVIAYVVDAPVLPNEFREIPEAVAYVCNVSAQLGKVIIRTERLLTVGELRINCPVEISRDDDLMSSISGGAVKIISEANLTLAGMHIAGTDILFDAGANLRLFRMSFAGPALIRLRDHPVAALTRRAAIGGSRQLEVVAVRGDAVRASLETSAGAQVDIEAVDSKTLRVDGEVNAGGDVSIKTVENEVMEVEVGLSASAKSSVKNAVSASTHRETFTAKGDNHIGVETVVGATVAVDFKGPGKVTAKVNNTQSHERTHDLSASKATHSARDNTAFNVTYTVGGRNASASASVTEDGAEIAGTLRGTVAPGAEGEIGVNASTIHGDARLALHGKGKVDVNGTEVSGEFRAEFAAKESALGIRNGRVRGITADAAASAHLESVLFENLDVGGNISVNLQEGAFVTFGAALNADFSPASHFRLTVGPPPGAPRNSSIKKIQTRAGAASPAEFVIADCTFNVTGNEAPIHVSGLEMPVRIERNIIRAPSFGIVAGEVAAPLTIRSNVLINCGIGIDGDIEGEGRTGYAPGPYLISGNTIREGYASQAITIQDAKMAIVEFNDIAARSGLVLSAAYAQVTSNIFNAATNGSVAIRTSNGPNGPAALIATGNTITGASPLVLMPDTYARFESNRFVGVVPDASDEPIPVFAITIGNGLGTVSAAFRNNEFNDVTIAGIAPTFFELTGNSGTIAEIGLYSLPPNARTIGAIIDNNTFSGDFPSIVVESTSLRMRGNIINDLDFGVSGNFGTSYAIVEGNTFGGVANVASSEGGYLRLANNSFGADGFISDDGFLVNDPGGNNGINTENISSPLDFNGDGDNCVDYPSPERTDDPNNPDPCANGIGVRPPSPPGLPPPTEPAWPVF